MKSKLKLISLAVVMVLVVLPQIKLSGAYLSDDESTVVSMTAGTWDTEPASNGPEISVLSTVSTESTETLGTPGPSPEIIETPTETPLPTETPVPSGTPELTPEIINTPTETPIPTSTPVPEATIVNE